MATINGYNNTLISSSHKDHTTKKKKLQRLLPYFFYLTLPLLLIIRIYFYPHPLPPSSSSSSSFHPSTTSEEEVVVCDYTNGSWVPDKRGPLYNGTTCGTIKKGQNCIAHGRPDMGYLYWRWKPTHCDLPRFDPFVFLHLLRHKHLAFVGDSMARNQLESLLCMLATVSLPKLVYNYGGENKFRRWHFGSHNVTVSVYWSPFLVKGVEKSKTRPDHNELYLDYVDERWAGDLGSIDVVLMSVGHWFLHPAVYYERAGSVVLGCHYCPGLNYTEIGFYDVLRKAVRTGLDAVVERGRSGGEGRGINVMLTTFSPAHFEGEWDKFGACNKVEPYREEEKMLEGMDAEMRAIEVSEVELAKSKLIEAGRSVSNVRLEALDVTKLSSLRPDGHPGAYMNPFPFADGAKDRVQNDCVHWCLPGPVDTWNEIMLEVMNRWGTWSIEQNHEMNGIFYPN